MRTALLAAIRIYQRFISPYKGFHCAYRVHTGHASCSSLGYRAVRRHGVVRGLGLLRLRTRRCGSVHQRVHSRGWSSPASQRGFCDAGCDLPCDLPGCELPSCGRMPSACDLASCCDCGRCDWPRKSGKASKQEKSPRAPLRAKSRVEPGREREPLP